METVLRFIDNMASRMDGPLHFRIILQPLIAIMFATLDGVKDAKLGKPMYFWAVATNPRHRMELVKDGWKHFGKIFVVAIVLDVIYQLKVHAFVYPGEALVAALVLAVVPYLLVRGPVNVVVRLFKKPV